MVAGGATCQAYDLKLAACGYCTKPFSCNCTASTVFEQLVPACSIWGLCVLSYDCTNVCNKADPANAYQDISLCLNTRACQTKAECPNGACVAGVCTFGNLGDGCAKTSDCETGYCANGHCTIGGREAPCAQDTECASKICVQPQGPDVAGSCEAGTNFSPCVDAHDCLGGACLSFALAVDSPLTHTVCSDGLEYAPCADDSDCKGGGHCFAVSTGQSSCFNGAIGDLCRSGTDCGSGFCDVADAGAEPRFGNCVNAPP